jgi:hypothetical protein
MVRGWSTCSVFDMENAPRGGCCILEGRQERGGFLGVRVHITYCGAVD